MKKKDIYQEGCQEQVQQQFRCYRSIWYLCWHKGCRSLSDSWRGRKLFTFENSNNQNAVPRNGVTKDDHIFGMAQSSPDLNPIQNLWNDLKAVHKSRCANLVDSYTKSAVLQAKREQTYIARLVVFIFVTFTCFSFLVL